MNKNAETVLQVLAAWAIAAVILFIALSASSCNVFKHHQETKITQDSSHTTLDSAKAGTTITGSVKITSQDTAAKHTWWNWEKETTTTVILDTASGKPKQQTTHTTERGQGHSQEMAQNTQALDIDWTKVDTSAHKKAETNQAKHTSDISVTEKQIKGRPWWFIPFCIINAAILVWIFVPPSWWSFILALFRRIKKR